MDFKSVLKTSLKIIGSQALPIAETFGVPGAKNVREAVDLIHGNQEMNNDEAVKMLAATVDALDQRLQVLEGQRSKHE